MSGILIDRNVADGVALLTLDNPPLNLVTREMTRALDEGLETLAEDAGVRVLVVRGAGERAFCAGSDISEFPTYIAAGNVVEKKLRYENEIYSKLDDFPKPTIAAVDGLAYGGGLELAACCDLDRGRGGRAPLPAGNLSRRLSRQRWIDPHHPTHRRGAGERDHLPRRSHRCGDRARLGACQPGRAAGSGRFQRRRLGTGDGEAARLGLAGMQARG